MNRPNYKKLLNSKWTAVNPINKEKHFIVIKVILNDLDNQIIDKIIIESVLHKNEYNISYGELKNAQLWIQGWK